MSASVMESQVDVLVVVGAGWWTDTAELTAVQFFAKCIGRDLVPAGIMCANALAQAGVNVRIIDRRYQYKEIWAASQRFTILAPGLLDSNLVMLTVFILTAEVFQVRSFLYYNFSISRVSSSQSYGVFDAILKQANRMHLMVCSAMS
jgi:hypothetical protein